MPAKPILVALEPFRSKRAEALLKRRFRVRSSGAAAEAVYCKLKRRLDAKFLSRFPRLRVVATPTTGLQHIDLEECRRRRIAVVSLKGEKGFLKGISATAELAWGVILAAERNIVAASASVKRGKWNRDPFVGNELRGKTLGVIGLGRLGTMVARYGRAFGMRVLYADPNVKGGVPLSRLLAQSDVITLHVHVEPDTVGMIGAREFSKMGRRPLFVNTSRGELVDEKALLKALKAGKLRGAALDVLADEHRGARRNPLAAYAKKHSNLLIVPHIGGLTRESAEKAELFVAGKLAAR